MMLPASVSALLGYGGNAVGVDSSGNVQADGDAVTSGGAFTGIPAKPTIFSYARTGLWSWPC